MNIIAAIRELQQAVRSLRVCEGDGVYVEHTPMGTTVGLLEFSGAKGHAGMFQIVIAAKNKIKVINKKDPEDDSCGIAQVNGQPFAVDVFTSEELAAGKDHYVYLEFTPAAEETDDAEAVPATCEVKVFTELKESTPEKAYYLIGKIEVDDEGIKRIDQAHWPSAIVMHWYGPCLNILDEAEDG